MKSRWIINLLLLVAIAILGLVAHFEPGIEAPPGPQSITSLAAEQVHRIHLNRPIREDLVLIKQTSGDWRIEGSPTLPADGLKLRVLARLVEQRPVRSYQASDMDLQALQLDPPYATAVFNDVAIEFGNLEPIDDLRYVRVGEQVHLIPDNHLQLIEAGYGQFVRQRLFAENARIRSISLPDFSVSRSGDTWQVTPEQEVDSEALQNFIDLWQNAASVYIQPASVQAGADSIEVSLEDSDELVSFLIVARDPDLILARPDYGIQYRMGPLDGALLSLDLGVATGTGTAD